MSDILNTPEKQYVLGFIERNLPTLAAINDAIFYFGELGMQEFRTAELMGGLLKEHGFEVEMGACGFPSGFVAKYGKGKPHVALHCEYDGNPTNSQKPGITHREEIVPGAPGHCEGHNGNAAVMIMAALAARYAMEKHGLPGTLTVVGAPAEETLISRPYFVRDGVFDDVDVALHNHIGHEARSDYGHIQYSAISADFTFIGESAHAAVYPERARDALDAVVLMDVGMAQLREHLHKDVSIQRVFTETGHQPNVIPGRGTAWWSFRHPFAPGAFAAFEQGKRVAQGAALMANCELEVKVRTAVWPVILNETAAKVAQANIEAIGMPQWTEEEQTFAKALQVAIGAKPVGLRQQVSVPQGARTPLPASNDSGDISWKVPMARVIFPSTVQGVTFHHWTAGAPLTSSIAHKGVAAGAKGLAATIVDYLQNKDGLIEETWRTFREEIDGQVYKCLLPDGQKPPVELNRAEMEKYRALMEPHYRKGPLPPLVV